ncbi:phage protease [Alloyangia pacifica]|nr:phage protease [Alloyangia pacifica]
MTDTVLIPLSALELPGASAAGPVPEWIHLVPKGRFKARDGRGPWSYQDAAATIEESFRRRAKLHVDLNHSTETAAKLGLEAPAVGYITEMEERENGIWGRVDWTSRGTELLSDRAYWGVSPVIEFDERTREVRAIARAALTNDPSVANLTPLSTKETDMFLSKVAKSLGLSEDASEEDVLAALEKAKDPTEVPNEALSTIGSALGIEGEASLTAILATASGLRSASTDQGQALAALQTEVTELREGNKKRDAEAFVDQAIRDKRVGVKASRENYVALHMENPQRARDLIAALPTLGASPTSIEPPKPADGQAALSTEQRQIADLIGVDPAAMQKTLREEESQQ